MNSSKSQISLIIVTYRDAFQWRAKERGLDTSYQELSAVLQLSPQDMETLKIKNNARVRLSNAVGAVVVQAKVNDKCQRGFGYMPVSPYANRLTSYDPAKAKLPDFKRIEVTVEATKEDVTSLSELQSV